MRQWLPAALAVLLFTVGAAQAEYRLTILHTNDFHSRFGALDRFDRDCPAEDDENGKCFGGAARLATAIAEARARADTSLLLDAGDQFPATGDTAKARPMLLADLINRIGYDAITLGSHEFDEGPEVARGFIAALDAPVIMANAEFAPASGLADLIDKSVVIDKSGERLGIIGLTPAGGSFWTDADYISVSDPVDVVQQEVDRLTAGGVNKIILLSHSGYYPDQRIARETHGVDIIVGGHSHTYLSNTLTPSQGPYPTIENGVAIVHAWPFGGTLGELSVTFDDDGNLVAATGDQIRLDGKIEENPDIKALVASAMQGSN